METDREELVAREYILRPAQQKTSTDTQAITEKGSKASKADIVSRSRSFKGSKFELTDVQTSYVQATQVTINVIESKLRDCQQLVMQTDPFDICSIRIVRIRS